MNTFRSFRPTPILIILPFLTLVYLATLTADYYWDGITFALQIEKVSRTERGVALLFHQNHLLYSAVGYLLHIIISALGVHARALCVLQITNVFAGAAAVGIFFYIAERVTRSRYAATISSSALAFSAVWWKLATDADAYILSVLLILICANTLLSDRPRWVLSALALAGAMLIHQLASIFYPAAIVAVLTSTSINRKWSFAAKFSTLAWSTTVATYYLCAVVLHDIKEPLAVVKWAVSNQSGVSPSANPLHGLALLPRGNLDIFIGHSLALFRKQDGKIEKLLALVALVTAICFLVMFVRRLGTVKSFRDLFAASKTRGELWRAYAPMLITWIVAYLVFLIFWEPWQVLYRVFYLPPLSLVLGLALSSCMGAKDALPKSIPPLAIATLLLFNLAFFIAPHMRATSNPLIVAAREANDIWNENAVIYFSDHNEADTAFEYFNEQTEWRRLTAPVRADLDAEIQQVFSKGRQVWLNKGAAAAVDSNWLAKHAAGGKIIVDAPNAPAHYVELQTKATVD